MIHAFADAFDDLPTVGEEVYSYAVLMDDNGTVVGGPVSVKWKFIKEPSGLLGIKTTPSCFSIRVYPRQDGRVLARIVLVRGGEPCLALGQVVPVRSGETIDVVITPALTSA